MGQTGQRAHRGWRNRGEGLGEPGVWGTAGGLTDGGDVGVVEAVLCKANDQTSLAHPRVPDEQQLEEVVVGFGHGGHWGAGGGAGGRDRRAGGRSGPEPRPGSFPPSPPRLRERGEAALPWAPPPWPPAPAPGTAGHLPLARRPRRGGCGEGGAAASPTVHRRGRLRHAGTIWGMQAEGGAGTGGSPQRGAEPGDPRSTQVWTPSGHFWAPGFPALRSRPAPWERGRAPRSTSRLWGRSAPWWTA